MIRVTTFAGRKVAVFGLGASGTATTAALSAGGAEVAAWDDGAASRESAEKAGVTLEDLAAADWSRFAALVLAPGVPLTHPEPHWTVVRAKAAGVEVIGDVELFFRERAKTFPGSPVVAITGTNGKSTTTALLSHILKTAGRDVQTGGNIGRAVLTLDPPSAGRIHVLELSSFQIDLTPSLAPSIGVLINLSPDHLDRHGTMENYAAIKERLVSASDLALCGVDDELSVTIARRYEGLPKPRLHRVGMTKPAGNGYGVDGTRVVAIDSGTLQVLADVTGVNTLRGAHNAQNAAFACAAALHCGLRPEEIAAAVPTYPGLPHRMEEVGRIGKVVFINDSKATNADSTEKALASWERDIFWILGGKPKEGGITSLARYFPRIAKAFLIGEATEEFAGTLEGKVAFERCGTLDVAVSRAESAAAHSSGVEPVVLLSPACASYDQFRNFERRGDAFRDLVAALPGAAPRGENAP